MPQVAANVGIESPKVQLNEVALQHGSGDTLPVCRRNPGHARRGRSLCCKNVRPVRHTDSSSGGRQQVGQVQRLGDSQDRRPRPNVANAKVPREAFATALRTMCG
jgi:hypothetical protein